MAEKKADEQSDYSVSPVRLGLGAGALAGAGHVAHAGVNAPAPSYLDLGRSQWLNEARRADLHAAVGPGSEQVSHLAQHDPRGFRRLLLGEGVGGLSPELAERTRQVTFGGMPVPGARTGDLLLSSPTDKATGRLGELTRRITGGEFQHAAVYGPGVRGFKPRDGLVHSFPDSSAGYKVPRPYSDDQAYVRLRSRDLDDVAAAKMSTSLAKHMSRPVTYSGPEFAGMAVGEALPETKLFGMNRRIGRWLHPIVGWAPANSRLKSLLGEGHFANVASIPAAGCESGVCSSRAIGAMQQSAPGVLKGLEHAAPADLIRATQGRNARFAVEEMFLPSAMRTAEFLKKQRWQRLMPMLARAPIVAGLGGLGLYGVSTAVNRSSGR